jgi:hypothetical protein
MSKYLDDSANYLGITGAAGTENLLKGGTLTNEGTILGGTAITLGGQFTGFQTLSFDSGAAWTVDVGAGARLATVGPSVTIPLSLYVILKAAPWPCSAERARR